MPGKYPYTVYDEILGLYYPRVITGPNPISVVKKNENPPRPKGGLTFKQLQRKLKRAK